MFFTRRQLRHWAARVLFLWVFGLGVGVAHACMTASAAADAQQGVAAQAQNAAAGQGQEAHGHGGCGTAQPGADAATPGADPGDGHDATLKSNCSDFCDKAGSSIRSQYTGDDIQAQALQLPAVAIVVTVPAFEPVRSWEPRRNGAGAPPIPIPIAFLRLAL